MNGKGADKPIKLLQKVKKLKTRFTPKDVHRSEKTAKAAAKAFHALTASAKAAELGRAESAVVPGAHGGKLHPKKSVKKSIKLRKGGKRQGLKIKKQNLRRIRKALDAAAKRAVKKAEKETIKVGKKQGIKHPEGGARQAVKDAAKKLTIKSRASKK